MKSPLRHALFLTLALASAAGAVQLSDLSTTITRSEADKTLTKDYAYRILSDLTVRRVWNLDENRKLTIDFDPRTDKLVCIMVDYKKGVSPKQGTEDMMAIGHLEEKLSWNKLTKDKEERYGVRNASATKVLKAYAFRECNNAGKCIRISLYTDKPIASRVKMEDVSGADVGKTAMGSNNSGSAGRILKNDEERRLNTPLKTAVAQTTPAAPAVADDDDDTISSHIIGKTDEGADTAAVSKPEPAAPVAVTKQPEKKKPASQLDQGTKDLQAFLDKMGLGDWQPIHFIGSLVGIIVFFAFIGMMKRRAEARRLAAQAALLRGEHPELRPTAKR